jgi:diguanylate cyclase (GGDEF)-like protein
MVECLKLVEKLESQVSRLEVEKEWYEGILAAIGDGISIQDSSYRILYQNRTHREMMGDHLGEHCYRAYGCQDAVCPDCYLRTAIEEGLTHTVERRRGSGDESVFYEITVSPLRDKAGRVAGGIEVVRDASERKLVEERLRHLSSHDLLTGLFNRNYFEEELERLQGGRQFPVSFIMADVDDLKVVNDTQGHKAGDELLMRAAVLFREVFRAEDVVARIGGDEFAVVLPETDEATVTEVSERIRSGIDAWNEAYPIGIHLSLGSATAHSGDGIFEALKTADEQMYRDKIARTGRQLRRSLALPTERD